MWLVSSCWQYTTYIIPQCIIFYFVYFLFLGFMICFWSCKKLPKVNNVSISISHACLGFLLFVCSDIILGFQFTGRYNKNIYFNVLFEFRDELPFSFSCYNHSDRRKIVHMLFDCPSFGWKVTWLQTKNCSVGKCPSAPLPGNF